MKTKIVLIILSIVAVVSFTALTNPKKGTGSKKETQKYQANSGQTMTDEHQFD